MSERELDSSINDYIETETPKNFVKQLQWDMAIGLQEVDNLKPSKYLEKLLQENVTGEKTIYEVEHELKQYYVEKDRTDKTIQEEFECDLVSTRIVQLLEQDNFELSQNEKLKKDISRLENSAKQSAEWSNKLEKTKNGTRNSGLRPDRGYIGHKAAKMMKRSKNAEARKQSAIEEKSNLLKNIESTSELKINFLKHNSNRLLSLKDISLFYGDKKICENINFEVNQRDKISLYGKIIRPSFPSIT